MPAAPTGSTVPRRQLGRYLRQLRTDARMTVQDAANALEWSEPKMWRIETGQTCWRHGCDLAQVQPQELGPGLRGRSRRCRSPLVSGTASTRRVGTSRSTVLPSVSCWRE